MHLHYLYKGTQCLFTDNVMAFFSITYTQSICEFSRFLRFSRFCKFSRLLFFGFQNLPRIPFPLDKSFCYFFQIILQIISHKLFSPFSTRHPATNHCFGNNLEQYLSQLLMLPKLFFSRTSSPKWYIYIVMIGISNFSGYESNFHARVDCIERFRM